MQDEVKETLFVARDLIATKGWTQGALARIGPIAGVDPVNPCANRFCAIGAIWATRRGCRLRDKAIAALAAALPVKITTEPPIIHPVALWNDHRDRTKQEVLALYDRALGLDKYDAPTTVTQELELAE